MRTKQEGAISEPKIALSRHEVYHHPGPGFPASEAMINAFLLLVSPPIHDPLNKLRPLLTAGPGQGLLVPLYLEKLDPAVQLSAALPSLTSLPGHDALLHRFIQALKTHLPG